MGNSDSYATQKDLTINNEKLRNDLSQEMITFLKDQEKMKDAKIIRNLQRQIAEQEQKRKADAFEEQRQLQVIRDNSVNSLQVAEMHNIQQLFQHKNTEIASLENSQYCLMFVLVVLVAIVIALFLYKEIAIEMERLKYSIMFDAEYRRGEKIGGQKP